MLIEFGEGRVGISGGLVHQRRGDVGMLRFHVFAEPHPIGIPVEDEAVKSILIGEFVFTSVESLNVLIKQANTLKEMMEQA